MNNETVQNKLGKNVRIVIMKNIIERPKFKVSKSKIDKTQWCTFSSIQIQLYEDLNWNCNLSKISIKLKFQVYVVSTSKLGRDL